MLFFMASLIAASTTRGGRALTAGIPFVQHRRASSLVRGAALSQRLLRTATHGRLAGGGDAKTPRRGAASFLRRSCASSSSSSSSSSAASTTTAKKKTQPVPHDEEPEKKSLGREPPLSEAESAVVTPPRAAEQARILAAVRSQLQALDLDAFVVPSDDPHLSEYVAPHFERRAFLTGFTGSAGTAVVTRTEARVWTDSRYWLQAEQELAGTEWVLMRSGEPGVLGVAEWLGARFGSTGPPARVGASPRVGVDARATSAKLAAALRDALETTPKTAHDMFGAAGLLSEKKARFLAADKTAARNGVSTTDDDQLSASESEASSDLSSATETKLVALTENNPVDAVWGEARPAAPSAPMRVHALEYAGETVVAKLRRVREELTTRGAYALAVAALDDVCWLLNVRGADVQCNPVATAYCVVTLDETVLFCDADTKITSSEVREHLAGADVRVLPYEDVLEYLSSLPRETLIWLDPDRTSDAVVSAVSPASRRVLARSPVVSMKSVKNRAEIDGMVAAHLRDGAAVVRAFAELERRVLDDADSNEITVDECDVAEALERHRSADSKFLEPSFPTIAGSGANGAVVHYVAKSETASKVTTDEMLLVDSGGQYADGTTDATRTLHFGKTPTPAQRDAFTRVLKGNVAVDTAVFPENTPGFVLDAFARRHLWAARLDYGHGTGHGVGAALNVHEGPQSISPRFANLEPLKAGMVVSNEPGYYEPGAYGVRIENLLLVEPYGEDAVQRAAASVVSAAAAAAASENDDGDDEDSPSRAPSTPSGETTNGGKRYLKFSKLTHIPIDTSCLRVDLLEEGEIDWLDAYHRQVRDRLAPLLQDDPDALAWLEAKCRPVREVWGPSVSGTTLTSSTQSPVSVPGIAEVAAR